MSSVERTSPLLCLKRATSMDLACPITTSLVRFFAQSVLKNKWSVFCSLFIFFKCISLFTGTQSTDTCFIPMKLSSFKNSTISWVGFSGGQHHTVCLNSEGKSSINLICNTCMKICCAGTETCVPPVHLMMFNC